MTQQEAGHTLQTTAVIHEAYLKLGAVPIRIGESGSFFGVAAKAMRHVLVDHAARGGLPSAAASSGSSNSMRVPM